MALISRNSGVTQTVRNNLKQTPIPVVPRTLQLTNPDGTVTRSGQLLLEQLQDALAGAKGDPGVSGGAGPYIRTLLLKDTAIGNDIADHVPIFVAGTAIRVIGVLRVAIISDLTVRINLDGTPLITLTIPHATLVDTPVLGTAFVSSAVGDLAVLSFDVTASDGSVDAAGVCSFTLEWA